MGNAHTKEGGRGSRGPGGNDGHDGGAGYPGDVSSGDRSRRQSSRPDLSSILGGAPSSSRHQPSARPDAPFERRETKAEREARRLERERVIRLKERERSMKEEHVDGGFVVTMGIYTAMEDFSKPVVRQLQIERRIAPFWRGLDDFNPTWAEHQIIAAARGLEVPPADVVPEDLVPQPRPTHPDSPSTSLPNLNNLTVPMGPRTLSAASDKTGSNPGSSIPSPTSPAPPRISSPLKPAKKSLAAALSISSRNGSQQDIAPREINLPHDPFVNGQPVEVFLYKDGVECPICCMYYPRYLNKTRCCDQFICSECFVQIKRADPHLPEHHGEQPQDGSEPAAPPPDEDRRSSELTMEPASCPYCTQTEFGVTYEAPPFRRGLSYVYSGGVGSMVTAMSSTSSLHSNLSPTAAATTTTPSLANRRRAQSLSANAVGVISTDRIRPDWSTKLATARAQQRRRAAAADALHHAAFVIGNNEANGRSLFGRGGRFSRRNMGPATRGNESPSSSTAQVNITADTEPSPAPGMEPGQRSSSGRNGPSRERIDAAHLESMMMAEAIRLSLADEEERKKKADKEARKEAKMREKEDRKASKRRTVYGGEGGTGTSTASASSLSLSLSGMGRRRGNSLRMDASVAAAHATASASQSNEALSTPDAGPASGPADKGKAVDRGDTQSPDACSSQSSLTPTGVAGVPILSAQPSRGSSHLRQMSNASSISSASGIDSVTGSYGQKHGGVDDLDPRSSGLSLGRSEDEASGTEVTAGSDRAEGAQSMFNFRSLAQVVGIPIDGE
ncbi:uncharacterized protein BCR38DRAFT_308628, partial [Pseudomassariella vexata]